MLLRAASQKEGKEKKIIFSAPRASITTPSPSSAPPSSASSSLLLFSCFTCKGDLVQIFSLFARFFRSPRAFLDPKVSSSVSVPKVIVSRLPRTSMSEGDRQLVIFHQFSLSVINLLDVRCQRVSRCCHSIVKSVRQSHTPPLIDMCFRVSDRSYQGGNTARGDNEKENCTTSTSGDYCT